MNLLTVDTIPQVNEKLNLYFPTARRETETVPLPDAVGRYLSEQIVSGEDMPAFARSVVDGYAVKAADTFGVSESVPVFLKIIGESVMGRACQIEIRSGEAVYVPTGGMMPAGADAMVMIEYAELLDAQTVAVYKASAPGSGVMHRGEDFPMSKALLAAGTRISEKEIGLLACLGMDRVQVYRRPGIGLISSGDELVLPGEELQPGQIREVNSFMLAAHVQKLGGYVTGKYMVKDDFEAFLETAQRALAESDVLLISGGSSAGVKDMTAKVIDTLGEPGVFTHGVAVKPGKPTILGVVGRGKEAKLAVGLPGHPMSALMVYLTVVEPFLRKHFFGCQAEPFALSARLAENVSGGEGRETFLPVKLRQSLEGGLDALPVYAKSGSVAQLLEADGFLRIPVQTEGFAAGSPVEIIRIHS